MHPCCSQLRDSSESPPPRIGPCPPPLSSSAHSCARLACGRPLVADYLGRLSWLSLNSKSHLLSQDALDTQDFLYTLPGVSSFASLCFSVAVYSCDQVSDLYCRGSVLHCCCILCILGDVCLYISVLVALLSLRRLVSSPVGGVEGLAGFGVSRARKR